MSEWCVSVGAWEHVYEDECGCEYMCGHVGSSMQQCLLYPWCVRECLNLGTRVMVPAIALHVAGLGLIPDTPYGPARPTRSEPYGQSQKEALNTTDVAPKQKEEKSLMMSTCT